MNRRNSESPWNPADSVEVTPTEYEREVVKWLQQTKCLLKHSLEAASSKSHWFVWRVHLRCNRVHRFPAIHFSERSETNAHRF